jgi:two-component system, NarL family, response regulator DegU
MIESTPPAGTEIVKSHTSDYHLMTKIRILIADDHPIFRAALRQIIELNPDITIVAEAHDGQTALDLLPSSAVSAVLLDIRMPNKDGFEVARAIRRVNPAVEVIFLTLYNDERLLNLALDLGAKGYILKERTASDVIDCIKAVLAGDEFVSPQLTGYLIKRNRRLQDLAQKEPAIGSLTPIELRVL